MKITFTERLAITKTICFEKVYEPELQLNLKEKRELLKLCTSSWMFIDGELAGEVYGLRVRDNKETIEDCADYPDAIYCYSFTLLPKYQGKGLAKILIAYWLGKVDFPNVEVVSHATALAMLSIFQSFGGRVYATHENWYGKGRLISYGYETVQANKRI